MNTAIRAHRILSAMVNYEKAGEAGSSLCNLTDGRLGEYIGCYRNPGPDGAVIGIFADGLAWHTKGCIFEFNFSDLIEVVLMNGKESEGLLLKARDGRELQLPIKGQRGRFFDSLEMLRFLDRVMQDLNGGTS